MMDWSLSVNYNEAIELLESYIKDPKQGLPEEVFYFISRITPMVNVDLLIKNDEGEVLLTWREDGRFSPSWHIPGGIIRYQETAAQRIEQVALNELGVKVEFENKVLAMNEIIIPHRKVRGHFISLLFECRLKTNLDESLKLNSNIAKPGQWSWFKTAPENLITVHGMYKSFFNDQRATDSLTLKTQIGATTY